MSADDPKWRSFPVLRELHDLWWRARGGRIGKSRRPFSRDWNQLLETAGLLSAEQRREAERDAKLLQQANLLELRSVKYRPRLIDRVLVPVASEHRLATLFGDPTETDDPGIDLKVVTWEPELRFVLQARVAVAVADLLRLNEFLAGGGRDGPVVPIKERSLQIFGDEKRLDALLPTKLFGSGRLTLETLRCELIGEPLAWKRGPASDRPLLIVENAATWHSYSRWNEGGGLFSAVVYGKGFVVAESIGYLADIFAEIGGPRPLRYFGDLDPPGLAIPWRASACAQRRGFPPIEPHLWSYRTLLEVGAGRETEWEGDAADLSCLSWLGELADPVRALFVSGRRLAQEHVGWEILRERKREEVIVEA